MLKHYFPKCKIDGPIYPVVEFSHLGLITVIPKKCAKCMYLFEGECTRNIDEVGRYLNLDHGPCGIHGPTDPVRHVSSDHISTVEIPRKCVKCNYLKALYNVKGMIGGLSCGKDKRTWHGSNRNLDWGTWEPDWIYIDLPHPKITTKKLYSFVKNNDQIGFIKEYRTINPGFSLLEAKNDFRFLSKKSKL